MLGLLFTSTIVTILIGAYTVSVLKRRKVRQTVRKDGPRTHLIKNGTPTMGGIMAIISTFLIGVILLVFNMFDVNKVTFSYLLFGSIAFAMIGFWDDFLKVEKANTKGLSPKRKMVALLLVSAITITGLVTGANIGTNILFISGVASFVKIALGMLVMISTANAVNLTDGVDGLATSVGLVIMTFLATYAISIGNTTIAVFLTIVIGSFIAFLLFNWNKAKVFMGDVGSFFLGGVIGLASIVLGLEFILPIIAIVPVIEAISVIIQVMYYKKTKKRIFRMAPIHHHFEQGGWSELRVVLTFVGITILASGLAKMIISLA